MSIEPRFVDDYLQEDIENHKHVEEGLREISRWQKIAERYTPGTRDYEDCQNGIENVLAYFLEDARSNGPIDDQIRRACFVRKRVKELQEDIRFKVPVASEIALQLACLLVAIEHTILVLFGIAQQSFRNRRAIISVLSGERHLLTDVDQYNNFLLEGYSLAIGKHEVEKRIMSAELEYEQWKAMVGTFGLDSLRPQNSDTRRAG